jgi:hypothetical protein
MPCKRMTNRLKSGRGNSVVHPRSLREMLGATRSIKFPDKVSFSEVSKPAGRSVSEPRCSLVSDKLELSTLSYKGEDRRIYPNENYHNR